MNLNPPPPTFHINCPVWMKFDIRSANDNVKHLQGFFFRKSAPIGRTFLTDSKEMAYARRLTNPCDILRVKNTVMKFMSYSTSRSTPFSVLLLMQKVHIHVYKSSTLNSVPTKQLRWFLRKKILVGQLVEKFPLVYETRRFIAVCKIPSRKLATGLPNVIFCYFRNIAVCKRPSRKLATGLPTVIFCSFRNSCVWWNTEFHCTIHR